MTKRKHLLPLLIVLVCLAGSQHYDAFGADKTAQDDKATSRIPETEAQTPSTGDNATSGDGPSFVWPPGYPPEMITPDMMDMVEPPSDAEGSTTDESDGVELSAAEAAAAAALRHGNNHPRPIRRPGPLSQGSTQRRGGPAQSTNGQPAALGSQQNTTGGRFGGQTSSGETNDALGGTPHQQVVTASQSVAGSTQGTTGGSSRGVPPKDARPTTVGSTADGGHRGGSGVASGPPGAPFRRQRAVSPSSQSVPGRSTAAAAGSSAARTSNLGAVPPNSVSPILRSDHPQESSRADAFDVVPDAAGMVRFNFRGQPWPDVLAWLAAISGMSLDWQELPGDYLNLWTTDGYTLAQTQDLINRQLLARGYTLLVDQRVMTVIRTDQLNLGMVPRVRPEELQERLPHEFVRVSFPLDRLLAEDAAKELEPMLSQHGFLLPLEATNRLEAIDLVSNLRHIHALIQEEQSTIGRRNLVREFPLQFARASEVADQLLQLLHVKTDSDTPLILTPQQRIQQLAAARAAAARAAAAGQRPNTTVPGIGPAKPKPKISVMANDRTNSVLAHAPPDKMAIIVDAIQMLDVPTGRAQSLQAHLGRMQIYRLTQIDAESLVKSLATMGGLDPTTRLEADEQNNALIVDGSLADQITIRSLVEKLDGSGRRFEVVQLRKLDAEHVAGTLTYLLHDELVPQQEPLRYGYPRRISNQPDSQTRRRNGFRVDADVTNNRLLIKANDNEMEEVMGLLAKLGEVPARGQDLRRIRVTQWTADGRTADFLERVRGAWSSVAPHPLILPEVPDTSSPQPSPRKAETQPEPDTVRDDASADATGNRSVSRVFRSAQLALAADPPPRPQTHADPESGNERSPMNSPVPPVRVTIGPDGRLVITSQDTQAVQMLEDLMSQLAPPAKDFHVFQLRNTQAFWVRINLEHYFKDDEKEKELGMRSGGDPDFPPFSLPPATDSTRNRRLSDRRPVRFIDDATTNSILVRYATPEQLATIAELIELYDVPEPIDGRKTRVTKLFFVRYSRASAIAETLKDAYRDLLSSNDRTFNPDPSGQQQPNPRPDAGTFISNYGTSNKNESRTSISFKGKLSIGVNELTNALVVSADGESLVQIVGEMIMELDQAATPLSKVVVSRAGLGVGPDTVERVRNLIAGGTSTTQRPSSSAAARSPARTTTPQTPSGPNTAARQP